MVNRRSNEFTQSQPGSRPDDSWLVAVIANLKDEDLKFKAGAPPDAGAEFDRWETIHSIQQAIESAGHRTIFVNANPGFPFKIREANPDICFNIAEGLQGEGREAHVPAVLEMFRLPFTASGVVANAISLDKTLTKRLWRDAGLPVVPFQEFGEGDEPLRKSLRFPLFVKPAREGTGMGVDQNAVVDDEPQLRERVAYVIQTYRQPALVESFLPGREFTVGLLGGRDAAITTRRPHLYNQDGFHRFPILEIENQQSVTPGIYGYKAKSKDLTETGAPDYLCPAELDSKTAAQLYRLALRAHRTIGVKDVSRVDFRLDGEGNPYLLEINNLPGLNPAVSDLCIMARAEGLPYNDLILEILDLGAARFGLI